MSQVSRRRFLYGTAATAAAVSFAACSGDTADDGGTQDGGAGGPRGSDTRQPDVPDSFGEAPSLAEQVRAGDLPPVGERLPEKPYVIPHRWMSPGKYGGTLRLSCAETDDPANKEYMYGHSLLRWLNDCKDLGPGLVEQWESNKDASEWTFHLRKGLRWSDGEPCTTADILFWWEDLVQNEDHPETPPDELRSGTGAVAEVSATDDHTLVLKFDAPAPLTPDRVANWVNGGNGMNGPIWILPKHYLKKFHPTYNDKAPADWANAGGFDVRGDYAQNPDCPTLTGWRLVAYNEGTNLEWERNPYYWCVDRKGNQLPYVDRLLMTANPEPEVAKLDMQGGRVDFAHGPFVGLELGDVASFRENQDRSGLRVLLWDSGAGGGATVMLNQDYRDEELRTLFRDSRFRRALSYAIDRAAIRKTVYYNTGEQTTGTLSPKAVEYHVDAQGRKIYRRWRDSYVEHAPKKAERLLDDLGLDERDAKRNRKLPGGGELKLRLDYPGDAKSTLVRVLEMVAEDWSAAGVATSLNPVPPEGYQVRWSSGELMTNTTWELGDGPNHLVFPHFLVPISPDRWAPLQGQFYAVRGTPAERTESDVDPYQRKPPRIEPEKGGPVERLWKLYDQTKTEPDEMNRTRLVWKMIEVHIEDGPFMHGTVANYPQVILAHQDLRNVPDKQNLAQGGFVNPWIHPTPAAYDPEAFFWNEPSAHE